MRRMSSTHSSSTRILRDVVYVRSMPSSRVARLHMETESMAISLLENTRSAMRHSNLSSKHGEREEVCKLSVRVVMRCTWDIGEGEGRGV